MSDSENIDRFFSLVMAVVAAALTLSASILFGAALHRVVVTTYEQMADLKTRQVLMFWCAALLTVMYYQYFRSK